MNATYTVYNASAGSGKTYSLIRDILGILLQHKDPFYFRHILAITFTNKATTEMKERLLASLKCFSTSEITELKSDLAQKLNLSFTEIEQRSEVILKAILQDYSSLQITTIDSFTHRIIRSFAFDFQLGYDFEIELDTAKILREAVERVIAQTGISEQITEAVLTFALENSDDDKSWDISNQLFDFSNLLLNETNAKHFEKIAHKTYLDYQNWRKELTHTIESLEKRMKAIGNEALAIIENAGLQRMDFIRGTFPGHFIKLATNWEEADFFDQSALRKNIENGYFYTQKIATHTRATLENILPELIDLYLESEKIYPDLVLYKLWWSALHPMSMLHFVQKALTAIKKEKNILFISDFNEMIAKKIKDEPAPFIYERLGERYHHYFIDEMQDTSVLQWSNLINLIDNALAQENGSLLLVGDVKQSIYRWRGSVPEQFMELANQHTHFPFKIAKNLVQLDTNYRSFSEIIDFNNRFFGYISKHLPHSDYENLYRDETFQKNTDKTGGYVEIQFLAKPDKDEDKTLRFPQKVLETLQQIPQEFNKNDICILVRKNKEGAQLAQYLTENGVSVMTSESLWLLNNEKIQLLVNFIKYLYDPSHPTYRFQTLYYLYKVLHIQENQHLFFEQFAKLRHEDFLQGLTIYTIDIQNDIFHAKNLYDAVEYLSHSLFLDQKPDVYLQFFLDIVLDFQIKNGSNWGGFITYFDENAENFSINVPENKDAIRIMSIHKAKGLEFPVVIFPYEIDIYKQLSPKIWYEATPDEPTYGFTDILIPYKEDLQYTNEQGAALYQDFRAKSALDNFNILYVAFTRAREQLYIITDYPLTAKGELRLNYSSGLLGDFLTHLQIFDAEKLRYSFGHQQRIVAQLKPDVCKNSKSEIEILQHWISHSTAAHQLVFEKEAALFWNNPVGDAINIGNLMHKMLAEIITADDVPTVVHQYIQWGYLPENLKNHTLQILTELVQHTDLQHFFSYNVKVFCERELILPDGKIYIPDRIVFFNDKTIGILDYKTGSPLPEHRQQLEHYVSLLSQMNYQVVTAYLVYISHQIEIISL